MPFGLGSSKKLKNTAVDDSDAITVGSSSRLHQGCGSSRFHLKNKLSALVVDDNRVNRKIHKTLLSSLGVDIKEARNGQEAVDICACGDIFDLILIDMEMPVMDGPEATMLMRSMGVKCKIIGVSSNSRGSEKQEFLAAGIDEFHVKPMTRSKIISLLEEIDHENH